jgi:hypothetical protein
MGGTDLAREANWWSDYAEHVTIFAVAGVLAASRGPGWRILRSTPAAVWLYLGFVATLVLPHDTGSWDYVGPICAIANPERRRTRIDGHVTRWQKTAFNALV